MLHTEGTVLLHEDIGAIHTIRDEGMPFDAHNLAQLLALHDPNTLERLDPAKDIVRVPFRKSVVLRWNIADIDPFPRDLERFTRYITHSEREHDRLQRLGMPMLSRNVFIVENDPHKDAPGVYMAVEKRGDGTTLGAEAEAHGDRLDVQRMLLRTGAILTNYYDVPVRHRVLEDQGPGQCAADGALYDYDPYITGGKTTRHRELDDLMLWTKLYIEQGTELTDLRRKIERLRNQLPKLLR